MKHLGRKLYHLFGGLSLLSCYFLLGRERALILYAILFITVLVVETARFAVPAFNAFLYGHFAGFFRPKERNRITGTAPYVLGIGSALYFYHAEIAAAAVCFLAFGDVAATTVGERWGRTKIGEKSLEGSIAFVAVALAAGALLSVAGLPLAHGLILAGAITAAGVELLPLQVNDNLSIPLVSGGVMELIACLTGCG